MHVSIYTPDCLKKVHAGFRLVRIDMHACMYVRMLCAIMYAILPELVGTTIHANYGVTCMDGMSGACNAYHSTHLLKKAGSHAFKANGAVVLQAPHEAAVQCSAISWSPRSPRAASRARSRSACMYCRPKLSVEQVHEGTVFPYMHCCIGSDSSQHARAVNTMNKITNACE